MPLLKKLRTLACKLEATVGTAETLSATDGAFNAQNIMIQADIDNLQRESSNTFGYLQSSQGAQGGTCSFSTDLQLTDDTEPLWLSTLLQACGYSVTASVFTPLSAGVTGSAGNGNKTVTIASYQDGVKKYLAGAVGNFRINAVSGRLVTIEWEFRGIWQTPVDAAMIVPTYPLDRPSRFANSTITYNSVAQCVESVVFDAGNEIILRECPDTEAGYKSGLIVDRTPTISINPEAQLVADEDRYGDWISGTEAPFSCDFIGNTGVGDSTPSSMTLAAPKAQIVDIQESDRNGLVTDEVSLQCNRNENNVDQDVSISFTAAS